MPIESYPLQWPEGWPRTLQRRKALFSTSLADARDGLMLELKRMGATHVVLSTNLAVRKDGLPYAKQRQPDDPGVAVYFRRNGHPQVIACDQWLRIDDNMQAIRRTVEAIRGMERWGSSEMTNRAWQGYALSEGQSPSRGWWDVLGVSPQASLEDIDVAFRQKVKVAHPDVPGGSTAAITALYDAVRQAREARGAR